MTTRIDGAAQVALGFARGDTLNAEITIHGVDWSDDVFTAEIRTAPEASGSALASFTVSTVSYADDATTFTIKLPASETDGVDLPEPLSAGDPVTIYYDVKRTRDDERTTLLTGEMKVLPSVTQAGGTGGTGTAVSNILIELDAIDGRVYLRKSETPALVAAVNGPKEAAEAAQTAAEAAQTAAESARDTTINAGATPINFGMSALSSLGLNNNAVVTLGASGFGTVAGDGLSATVGEAALGIFDLASTATTDHILIAFRMSRSLASATASLSDGTSGGERTDVALTIADGDEETGYTVYGMLENRGENQSPATNVRLRIDDRTDSGVGDITVSDFRLFEYLPDVAADSGVGNYPYGYDYYVDAAAASSAGTRDLPFSTLAGLASALDGLTGSDDVRCYVARGVYADDNLDCQSLEATASVFFEKGTRITNTPGNTGSCVQAYGTGGSLTIYGNGLSVEDFDTGTGNGFGSGTSATLTVHDAITLRCYDGYSAHNTSHMALYRCQAYDSGKFGVAHVNTATSYQEDCIFECTATPVGGVGVTENNEVHEFVRTTFQVNGGGTARALTFGSGTVLTNCRIGTKDSQVTLSGGTLNNCYLNITPLQGNTNTVLNNCCGNANLRLRAAAGAGTGLAVTGGVFEPPSGQVNFLNGDFDSGSYSPVAVTDVIVGAGFTTALSFSNSATLRGYWDAAGNTFEDSVILAANSLGTEAASATGVSGLETGVSALFGEYMSGHIISACYDLASPRIAAL